MLHVMVLVRPNYVIAERWKTAVEPTTTTFVQSVTAPYGL